MSRIFSTILILSLLFSLLCGCNNRPVESESETATGTGSSETASESETSSAENNFFLELSEEYALKLLSESLPEDSCYTVDVLDFSAPNIITVSGDANIARLAEDYMYSLSYISDFLPTKVAYTASLEFNYSPEDGVEMNPIGIEVLGYDIPVSILPESMTDYFEEDMNSYFDGLVIEITAVEMTDTTLILRG